MKILDKDNVYMLSGVFGQQDLVSVGISLLCEVSSFSQHWLFSHLARQESW